MEIYIIFIFALLLSYFLFKNFQIISKKLKLLDNKNLHYANNSTPTGSGIIFLIIFILSNVFYFHLEIFGELIPNRYYFLILSAVILSITSFKDDIKPIDHFTYVFLVTFSSIIRYPLSPLQNDLQKVIFAKIYIVISVL